MHWYFEVLQKYAVFDGRARRKEYWMFFLFNIIVVIAISIIETSIGLPTVLSTLYSLAVLLPGLGVTIRRLHDTGRSGWWVLIGLIPLLGVIILLIFFVQEGEPGENQYGPNPKESS